MTKSKFVLDKIKIRVENEIKNKNYELIEYVSSQKIIIKCDNGHIWQTRIQSLNKGNNCLHCLRNKQVSLDDAIKIAKAKGGLLLSKCENKKYIWKCKNGHEFEKNIYAIVKKDSWCDICKSKWKGEEICREIFETIFKENFPKCRPKWLKNSLGKQLELDGFCQKLNIAFEHNGRQHYEYVEKFFGDINKFTKNVNNDIEKYNLCNSKNIKLIIIPELGKLLKFTEIKSFLEKEFLRLSIELNISNLCIGEILISVSHKLDKTVELINMAKMLATNNNGKCLSNVCLNVTDKLKWECSRGHIWEATLINVKARQWCANCSQRLYWIEKNDLQDMIVNKKMSATDISKIINIPRFAIFRLAKYHNIKMIAKLGHLTKEDFEDMYIKQNLSVKQMASLFNVAKISIRRKLKSFNLYFLKETSKEQDENIDEDNLVLENINDEMVAHDLELARKEKILKGI